MRFSPHGIAFDNGGDYRMLFFNSDGSVGEMCGNGARCICRYGFENGLAGEVYRHAGEPSLLGWLLLISAYHSALVRCRCSPRCSMGT